MVVGGQCPWGSESPHPAGMLTFELGFQKLGNNRYVHEQRGLTWIEAGGRQQGGWRPHSPVACRMVDGRWATAGTDAYQTALDSFSTARALEAFETFLRRVSSLKELDQHLGESGISRQRMALLSKLNSGGMSWKYRISWDRLRFGTSDFETVPERTIHPAHFDAIEYVKIGGAACQPGQTLDCLIRDSATAFHNAFVTKPERKVCACGHAGVSHAFSVTLFGPASSPCW
jgi:hypothetical protein